MHARAAAPKSFQLFGIQQIAHHYESVAMKDARGTFHFVRSDDLESVNAVVLAQVLAQRDHVGIIVDASLRRARIRYAEAGIRLRRIAVLINGFVGGRAFVPANHSSSHQRDTREFAFADLHDVGAGGEFQSAIGHRRAVHLHAVAFDQAERFAGGAGQVRLLQQLRDRQRRAVQRHFVDHVRHTAARAHIEIALRRFRCGAP